MHEKLVPGDRVIKIPARSDSNLTDDMKAPFGSSAVVIVGEKQMLTESLDTGERYTRYGCVIKYDNANYDSPTLDGEWFRCREGLLKISPDEDTIREEDKQKFDDLNEEIKRVRKEIDEHPERWIQTLKS